ncbi:MAG TPA: 30S ribosomal protein S20 [Longimicrobiales bacterium]|nr:30S ribosomal protein S20 [Longimicrobiales bacterium]
MANTRSAEKRMRQDRKRNAHNRTQRSRLKTAIKKVSGETDPQKAEAEVKETAAMLDRMASRRLIHPNKAARKKSQLAKAVKKLGKQA